MSDFKWNETIEAKAAEMKGKGFTFSQIAESLGTTAVSVKHKIRRLQQAQNQDRYKHTDEKLEQIQRTKPHSVLQVLETHAGFGGLTRYYSQMAYMVTSLELKQERVDAIKDLGLSNVSLLKTDSEREIYGFLYQNRTFDIVDVDPYGLPSRYFPHVFGLIDNGMLYLTFPVMGVAQINKITIEHYRVFWGIELADKNVYLDKIQQRLIECAFMHKRQIEFMDIQKINRIYRLAIQVKKTSMLDIVGLEVNRCKPVTKQIDRQLDMFE